MKETEKIRNATIVGAVATVIIIATVPVILVIPGDRSPYFIHRILWAEFLTLTLWAYFGGLLSGILSGKERGAKIDGAAFSGGMALTSYACTSFFLMLLQAFLPENSILNRFHFAAQAILLAVIVIRFAFLLIASSAQAAGGTGLLPDGVRSPDELGELLNFETNRLEQAAISSAAHEAVFKTLKLLSSKIKHSLPPTGTIGNNKDYHAFAAATEELTQRLSSLNHAGEDSMRTLPDINSEVEELLRWASAISTGAKRG